MLEGEPFSITKNSSNYNICSVELMDCSAFGLGSRMLACKDCSPPDNGSCAEDVSSCLVFTPEMCTGPCRKLIPGGLLIYGDVGEL